VDKIDEQRQSDKDLNRLLNKLTETLNGWWRRLGLAADAISTF